MPLSPEEIQADPAFDGSWYYKIELAPRLTTPGRARRNVLLTRDLLSRVDIDGALEAGGVRALDVGMMEGMFCVLLARRGITDVTGYDRFLRRENIDLVQRALDTSIRTVEGELRDLPHMLGHATFDVVLFSGVLYHMFDPMGGLATVRGLVRNGGIVLIETQSVLAGDMALHFNTRFRFDRHGLWMISVPCLEYLARFMRLEPLDVVYLESEQQEPKDPNEPRVGRVALACRAVSEPLAEPDDSFITSGFPHDFAEFLDWSNVASDAPVVGYADPPHELVRRPDGLLDAWATVQAGEEVEIDRRRMRLRRRDRY